MIQPNEKLLPGNVVMSDLRHGIYLKANGLHNGKIMSVSHFDNDKSLHKDYSPIVL